MIDNYSANGSDNKMTPLSNDIVLFFPQNKTGKIQPHNAGIIAALKLRYTRFQIEQALDLIGENV